MSNRTFLHVCVLLIVVFMTAIAHYAISYSALIRGYETSSLVAYRNVGLILLLALLPIVLRKLLSYRGSWIPYTACVVLFSIGLTVQYRLFSDREYAADIDPAVRAKIEGSSMSDREKSRALLDAKFAAIARERAAKIRTAQLHYVTENYSAEKKQMVGLPPSDPHPVDLSQETPRPVKESMSGTILSSNTLIPLFAIISFIAVFFLVRRDDVQRLLQDNGVVIVLLTLVPLLFAAVTSQAGKFLGNMTPWEPAKVPFLIGFAAILAVLYRNLARTYWGLPRAKDVLPLVFMAVVPFLPFFVLKDFGQMMVFSAVYATLYLIAVRRFSQRFVLVGTVLLAVSILIVGALPPSTQAKVPLLPTLAGPVRSVLPDRIQQRFHLWLDGFDPPSPDTDWWKDDYDRYYADLVKNNPKLPGMLEDDPALQRSINTDAWFDMLAFQPAQATFGIASGGVTGRGFGLGYPELIPVSDSDYIYAAIGEELGLSGGLLITFALILFVTAGVQIARDSRDMFSKLCAIGLAAFIGFQALVNIGGITRALPMTGITLPFVSHGGFSLVTSFVMLGMLMAFSHRNAMDRLRDSLTAGSDSSGPAAV
ncbi:MAG: FtsW/RodA/SpoVE family cell cycle protein [Acidobacteria bacterium]|nr:FtsW/RodA/SpoVE family cell cycle protein [Acidobacteriota bacterium]